MPLNRYHQDLQRAGFQYDAAQEDAAKQLQRVRDELVARYEQAKGRGALGKLPGLRKSLPPVLGLYFWGGVGRGKTYLMDLFYDRLPFRRKMRVHFHRFMQRVHRELKDLQGQTDPLEVVADHIAKDAVVICFDEFFVTDITDAMILYKLFDALFERGVTLVATSNIVPDRLYENGLQRERFLPAIDLIKKHCAVLNVDSGIDYRLRVLKMAELYHSPLDAEAEISLKRSLDALCDGASVLSGGNLEVNNREIPVRARSEGVLWCDFSALCEGPRSQNDYIEIARVFHTVLLSNVPAMGAGMDDAARRFINLVDEFYDRHVKLIISAAEPIATIYGTGRLNFEFQRTRSRLTEMQSHEYLALEHLP